jgi:hypothetical protein
MHKKFTVADVSNPDGQIPTIYAERKDLIDAPLDWQKMGLQQTSSGYGRKLTMREKIHFEGKQYRLYCTCFSNSGSVWFVAKGKKIWVS